MAEQTLLTRIQLKYDSWENWSNDQLGEGKGALFVLKPGEIGICTIPAGVNDAGVQNPPHVLMKVGDNNETPFKDLPWLSAKAADVHEWAKQAGLDVGVKLTEGQETAGNVISGIEWDATANNGKGGIKYTTASVATSEGLKQVQEDLDAVEKDIADHRAAWEADNNTTYTFEKSEKGITITPSEGDAKTISFEYLTESEIKALIPTELGIMSITGKEAIVVTEGANPEVSLKLDSSGNVALTQGNDGLKASIDLSDYRKIADDEDTKYGIAYDSDNKVIKLVEGGANLEISAADFIADGMLEKVEVDNNANTITFTWNTDGGATVTTINLTDIADIYTAAPGATEVQVAISNTNEVSATLVNGGITEAKLHADVTTKLSKIGENTQAIVDITKDNGTIDQKIASYNTSKNFGDIITHNAADFATSAQGEKADTALQEIEVGTGLKVSEKADNKQTISFDETCVFVFNCGDSQTVI